jgi:hypothetical protein
LHPFRLCAGEFQFRFDEGYVSIRNPRRLHARGDKLPLQLLVGIAEYVSSFDHQRSDLAIFRA